MVADIYGVTGQSENVIDSPGIGEEKVSLERQAVPVPAGHLEDGFAAVLFDQQAAPEGRVAHYRALIIGDIYGIGPVFKKVDVLDYFPGAGPFHRAGLHGYDEVPVFKRVPEAFCHLRPFALPGP